MVVPGTSRFDPDYPGWRDQVATLYTALRKEVAPPSVRSAVVPNAKGALDTVVIALGSSGALTLQCTVRHASAHVASDRGK